MDPLLQYLITANIVTFLAFALDYLLCMRFPALDDTTANSLVLDVFPLAGGAVGMLLALFFLGGLGRGHRMNKDNVAWWFLALACLVAWGLVCLARFGIVPLDASLGAVLGGWNLTRLGVVGIYLVAINAVTCGVFAWDKHVAANGNSPERRVPEGWLLGLCLAGGSPGGLVAMHAARHKTKKWYFVWGLPLFIVLDVAVLLFAHMGGVI